MMSRPISEDDLQAFVDDRLDAERRGEIEVYLAEHPSDRDRIQGMIEVREELRAMFNPIAVKPVPTQLNLERLIEARRRPRAATWQAMAAALLLALGGLGGWGVHDLLHPLPTGVDALAQEANASFVAYAPDRTRPVELAASDSGELSRWFSTRLKRAVGVPDLSGSGYRLMGGRLVPTQHGPAGMLMYDDGRGSRFVMLMRPMAEPGDKPMHMQRAGAATSYAWVQDGLGYSLVGAADEAVLHPLVNEIRSKTANDT